MKPENTNKVPQTECFRDNDSIFRHLTQEEMDTISYSENSNFYKRGTIIYEEGSRISGFYCVQKGIIKIFKTGIDGREQIIRFAKKGDIMGFRSTLSNELACTTAKVIEDALICFVPGHEVIHLVKTNGNFAMELLKIACKELGEANDYITDIAQKTVRERLAEVLIHLKSTFNIDREGYLQVSLTREELASIVGTATESVIRLLSEFKSDGLIEMQGRRIKLNDIPKLIKLGGVHD
jgi:CRP/FNR family transcriptional regulator, polysaccharide utilization system transcription regulator